MRAPRLAPRLVGAAALVLIALGPERAGAAEFEVQADTALQGYEVASPWGDVVLQRRRFMQTVGLGVYNLQGKLRPGEADYRIVMLMRLDADFGINNKAGSVRDDRAETTFSVANGARFVPGLEVAPIDVMYGYIEGRNIARGLLGFKLGRQYMTDMLGWWSFDGALVRITTPFYVQAELYGGLEQRGGLPVSTSRFERQGIWRGSHKGFGGGAGEPSVTDYPSYQYTQPAPAFGFALESVGPSFIHGRFSYRRVYNTGTSLTQQFPDPTGGYHTATGTRISQERLGYAIDANKNDLGGLRGGFSYDLYSQLVASFFGGLEVYAGKRTTIGADVDYFVPTFDADSIWNWFTHNPITTATARVAVKFTRRFDATLSGGARLWSADGDPITFGTGECRASGFGGPGQPPCTQPVYFDPSTSPTKEFARQPDNRKTSILPDALVNLAARYRFATADIGLRGMLQYGARGSREGGDVDGEKRFLGDRFTLGTRLSFYGWNDPTRPDRDAASFSYMLAAAYKPPQVANFRVEFEHDINRLVGQRFRLVGLVNLLVLK